MTEKKLKNQILVEQQKLEKIGHEITDKINCAYEQMKSIIAQSKIINCGFFDKIPLKRERNFLLSIIKTLSG